jgi:hypothetical protein
MDERQAAFHRLAQVRWAGIAGPLVRLRGIPSTFSRDDKVIGVRSNFQVMCKTKVRQLSEPLIEFDDIVDSHE